MSRDRVIAVAVALATPVAGFALLLSRPSIDGHWNHQPSHFWIVLGAACHRCRPRLVDRNFGEAPG